MPYTFTLTIPIPATPRQIYAAWLDSLAHSQMTGGAANMSGEIGAVVSAWDGYISGRNLDLVPGERIVQSWRTSEFSEQDADSIVTVMLQEIGAGTLLTLEHSNVPDEHRSYEEGGWHSNYFEPMMAYFTRREREAGPSAKKSTPKRSAKSAPKPPPRRAAKGVPNSGGKSKQAARPKAKRAGPRAKASGKWRKVATGKSAASTKRRKRSKPAARKSGRAKRG